MDWTRTETPPRLAHAALPMQQHPLYGAACAAHGARVRHYVLRERGQMQAGAQVLIRRWPLFGDFALLSRGPVWRGDVGATRRALLTRRLVHLLRRDLRGVMATPEAPRGEDPLAGSHMLRMVSPGQLAILDLTPGIAALRAGLHGKWRNRLVRAEAAGIALDHGPFRPGRDDWLLAREQDQARARGYRRLQPSFVHAWIQAGGPQSTRLFVARQHGVPVAAMLFLRHGSGASYHVGWTGPAGRRVDAHRLLLWRAMAWLKMKGHQRLELGTLDTETTPGLARFKLGAGARPLQLGPTRLEAPGTALFARLAALRAPQGLPQASSSASQ